jgi:hypothetical protein
VCSLRLSYDYFINTLLYGRDSLSSEDIKTSLNSRELKRQESESYNVNHTKGLIVRGRTNNKGFR